jgi:hypothetical protein
MAVAEVSVLPEAEVNVIVDIVDAVGVLEATLAPGESELLPALLVYNQRLAERGLITATAEEAWEGKVTLEINYIFEKSRLHR